MLSQSFPMRIFPHICIPFSLYYLFYVPGAQILKRGVQMVERERVKSYAGKTTGKKRGETCLPSFLFLFFNL